MAENNSPGYIESLASTKKKSKEKLRLSQLIPSEILENSSKGSGVGIETLLNKYYEFMNMSEFQYQDTETHVDVILDNKAAFRIEDPNGENNQFYTDSEGTVSTLIIKNNNGVLPEQFTFDGTSSAVVDVSDNSITLTNTQQSGLPVGTPIKYLSSSLSNTIGLQVDITYYVAYSSGGKIKLSEASTLDTIKALSVATGATHSFQGISNTIEFPLDSRNVEISNGNELPGSLAKIESPIGQTLTVSGLQAFNAMEARITTPIQNWVGPGPSYTLNRIEDAMDIDKNSNSELDATHDYLEMMQKEIAASIPSKLNTTVHRNTLYKRIIDFYKLRGSSESIEVFFRLLFDEEVVVQRPIDNTLVPSAGDWQQGTNQFVSNKGFVSDKNIRIHDGDRYQKFSYLIKSGLNLNDWSNTFTKLVHPAGFRYFGEIGIILELTRLALGGDAAVKSAVNPRFGHEPATFYGRPSTAPVGSEHYDPLISDLTIIPQPGQREQDVLNAYPSWMTSAYADNDEAFRKLYSSIPGLQPGLIGGEDKPLLLELIAYVFGPHCEAFIARGALLSPIIGRDSSDAATYLKITGVSVAQAGFGYDSNNPPTITISSNTGQDAEATAIVDELGRITGATITDAGSDYEDASIQIGEPQINGQNGSGKISLISLSPLQNKKYTKKPVLRIDAPTATNNQGDLLESNVNATAEFVLKPTKINKIKVTHNGQNDYPHSQPLVTISDPEVGYTKAPLYTEDFENASVSNVNWNSWRRRDTVGVTHTVSIDTAVETGEYEYDETNPPTFEGSAVLTKALKIQTNGGLDTDASGDIGGAVAKLNLYHPNNVQLFKNNTIKVKFKAKVPSSNGATSMKAAYSTDEHGDSNWQTFTPTTTWQEFEFEYAIGNLAPTNDDYIGFQGDGSDGIVYVDDVSVELKYDRAIATVDIAENGSIDGINLLHGGSGFTDSPTVTIAGNSSQADALLEATEIDTINITNRGNGYVINPRVHLDGLLSTEARAKGLIKRIILGNHNTVDRVGNYINDYDQPYTKLQKGYSTLEENGYFKLKKNAYYDSSKRFDMNQRIEQFGHQTIDSNHINTINKFNTNSFVRSFS